MRVADVDLALALVDEEPLVLIVVDVQRGAHARWHLDIDHAVLARSVLGADLDCYKHAEQPEILAFSSRNPYPVLPARESGGHEALPLRREQLATFVLTRSMRSRASRIRGSSATARGCASVLLPNQRRSTLTLHPQKVLQTAVPAASSKVAVATFRHSPSPRDAAPSGLDRIPSTLPVVHRAPRGPSASRKRLDGAAPESNRPSVGLPHRTGFEVLNRWGREPRSGVACEDTTRLAPRSHHGREYSLCTSWGSLRAAHDAAGCIVFLTRDSACGCLAGALARQSRDDCGRSAVGDGDAGVHRHRGLHAAARGARHRRLPGRAGRAPPHRPRRVRPPSKATRSTTRATRSSTPSRPPRPPSPPSAKR